VQLLLAVFAVSISIEHVVGDESSERVMRAGHDYDLDMSATTQSDGEEKIGHYGDYSDWVKKYHLGKHHPFHATKEEVGKPISIQYHGTHKAKQQVAPSAPKKVVAAHPKAKKAFKAEVAKAEAAKAEKPEVAKAAKPEAVHDGAKAKKHKAKAKKAKKAASLSKKQPEISAADKLEAELNQLEHKAPVAEATKSTAAVKTMVKKDQAEVEQAQHKAPGTKNLAESGLDQSPKDINLDDLEASLKKLEAQPTELIQDLDSDRSSDSISLDNLDSVALIQEGSTAHAKAPDMMAMLAKRFKKKARAHRKKLLRKLNTKEHDSSSKEADMAKKFQMQFTKSLNHAVKLKEEKTSPRTIQEAMAHTTTHHSHKSKMGKGSISREDSAAMKDAEQAKKMTQQFLKYRKQREKQREIKNDKAPTKENLSALFHKKGKIQDEDQELGEPKRNLPEGASEAKSWAMSALHASARSNQEVDENSKDDKQGNVASLFGLRDTDVHHGVEHQELGEAHKPLLDDGDARALQLQKEMLEHMVNAQNAEHEQTENSADPAGGIASLFGQKKRPEQHRLMSASRERDRDQFTQARQMQTNMLQKTQQKKIAPQIKQESISEAGLSKLFKGEAKSPSKQPQRISQEAKDAVDMQREFTQHTNQNGRTSKYSNVKETKQNIESLFAHGNAQHERQVETGSDELSLRSQEAETAKQHATQMLEQTKHLKGYDEAENRLGSPSGNAHEDVEHLFQGDKHMTKHGRFAYMSHGKRKQLQQEFSDSANHQLQLLRQMERSSMAARSQEDIQTNERSSDGKWDELAYQNKMRTLFGAKPIHAPKKRKLRHKTAVQGFLADVRKEEVASGKKFKTDKHVYSIGEDADQQMQQQFTDLIQLETSQFNEMINKKKQEVGDNKEDSEFFAAMKSKFDALKEGVARFKGTRPSLEQPKTVPHEDTMIQLETGHATSQSPNRLQDEVKSIPQAEQSRVLDDVEAKVADLPADDLQSSMLNRLSKLFRNSA
jgi:hypothetical protein